MVVLVFVYLNILYVITDGLANLKDSECKDITQENIVKMCRNPNCVANASVANFCEHVYENMFKCQANYLPIRYVCDGINHCVNGADEDPVVCSYIACEKNFYKCQENSCIDFSKLCNGINDCRDGSDESPLVCRKLIDYKNTSCPIIFEETHVARCQFSYGNIPSVISCYEFLPPKTEAEVTCNMFFNSGNSPNYLLLTCQNNGTWDKEIIKCTPDCGVVKDIKISPLIINGVPVNIAKWPWYSALFTLIDKKWIFFCSSTIISSNRVITAAHCIWNMPKEDMKVTAGNMFSNFYAREPVMSQVADVQNVFIHPLYQDSLGNYGSDIAILKLKNHFSFNEFVLPICVNWTLRNIVTNVDDSFDGKVAGMGITENGTISGELRATKVQIMRNEDCVRNQRYEFRKYVTVASFCAKGVADGVVCNGDSGSGLAVKSKISGKWILEGIVSISPKNPKDILCDKNYYTIYTNVGMYSNWIYQHFSN